LSDSVYLGYRLNLSEKNSGVAKKFDASSYYMPVAEVELQNDACAIIWQLPVQT